MIYSLLHVEAFPGSVPQTRGVFLDDRKRRRDIRANRNRRGSQGQFSRMEVSLRRRSFSLLGVA
jgi:hypothetical protein